MPTSSIAHFPSFNVFTDDICVLKIQLLLSQCIKKQAIGVVDESLSVKIETQVSSLVVNSNAPRKPFPFSNSPRNLLFLQK